VEEKEGRKEGKRLTVDVGKLVAGSFYLYAPSKEGAIFFTLAFAATGLLHLLQCLSVRSSLHRRCLSFQV